MADVPARDMARFGQALGFVFVGVALFPEVGILAPPIAVAVYVAGRNPAYAAGIVVCALIAGGLGRLGGVSGASTALIASAAGLPAGLGLMRGWTYGRTVAVTTALLVSLNFGFMTSQWDVTQSWAAESRVELDATINGPERTAFEEQGLLPAFELQLWMLDNIRFVAPGMMVGVLLTGVCVMVSVAASVLYRSQPPPAGFGSFRTMRPPDWLAWVVIAVAALWFVDDRWPNELVRLVSWNGAIALSGIYWLNGLGILLYAVAVLRPHPVLVAVAVVVMVFTQMLSVLPIAGLFDTWAEFRRRIDGLAAARASRDASQDGPE